MKSYTTVEGIEIGVEGNLLVPVTLLQHFKNLAFQNVGPVWAQG